MAGISQERHRLAGGPRHGPGDDGPAAALSTAATRPAQLQRAAALLALLVLGSGLRAVVAAYTGDLLAGTAFAVLLLAVAAWARPEMGGARPVAILAGAAVGVALLLPGLWLQASGLPPRTWFIPAPTLAGYSALLLLVVPAEEIYLRAILQPMMRRALGPGAAIAITAAAFAAIHVAAYGMVAVPLDLGVGLILGWLRERSGSTAACAVAHLVADLGSWWLP